MERIIDIEQPGVGTLGRLVDLGWAFHVQRFVMMFVVEDFDKLIEAGLPRKEVGGGLGGFFFQFEMHAFVTTILLRVARLDLFDTDSQTKPPYGEVDGDAEKIAVNRQSRTVAEPSRVSPGRGPY